MAVDKKASTSTKADARADGGSPGATEATDAVWLPDGKSAPKKADQSRLARIEKAKAAHSLFDLQALPAGSEPPSAEELKDRAHMLKTFFTWISKGSAAKSAPLYVEKVKVLLRDCNVTLSFANTSQFLSFVKESFENARANSIFSAAVKKLQTWLEERGSCEGPWEEQATPFEKMFDQNATRGPGNQKKVAPTQPAGAAMSQLFGARPMESDVPEPQAEQVKAVGVAGPSSSETSSKSGGMYKDIAKWMVKKQVGESIASASSSKAVSSPSREDVTPLKEVKATLAADGGCAKETPQKSARQKKKAAAAAHKDSDATVEAAPEESSASKRQRGAPKAEPSPKAKAKAKAKGKGNAIDTPAGGDQGQQDSASPPAKKAQTGKKAKAKAKSKAKARKLAKGRSTEKVADGKVAKKGKAKAKANASKLKLINKKLKAKGKAKGKAKAKAVCASPDGKKDRDELSAQQKELGRRQQLSDLLKTARSHIYKRDFDRAEQVCKVIASFCEKEGVEMPTTLKEEKRLDATGAIEDQDLNGLDEAPKGELEVARDVLRRCFAVRHPHVSPPVEHDSEVLPAPKKVVKKKVDEAEADAGGDEHPATEEEAAAKFAAIAEAEPQDYVQLHAVAAAFRAHLVSSGKKESDAEDAKKAFVELFSMDDRAFSGMASKEYVALARSEDKRHGAAAAAFSAFWKKSGGASFPEPPPRLPTSEERNIAAESGLPKSWRVQVFHRTKRDDLVVLTAPGGAREFTTKAGLRSMASAPEDAPAEVAPSEENPSGDKGSSEENTLARRLLREEKRRCALDDAKQRKAATARFHEAFAGVYRDESAEGVALHGALPPDCLGTYLRLAEQFGGRPAYELLSGANQRVFLFNCRGRWVVADDLTDAAQPFAFVQDDAALPHEVDRDGSAWMVRASAEEGDGYEVTGAPAWCAALTREELLSRTLKVARWLRSSCGGCNTNPKLKNGPADDYGEDAEGKAADWATYEEVPDATPEERAKYPSILRKFDSEGYPYLSGVRKLMACYGKSPSAMATKTFHALVRNDPMNAVCNGYDSSAVLYFIMFWEKFGSLVFEPVKRKTEREVAQMTAQERNAYNREFSKFDVESREAYEIKEQAAVLTDLQIDMPLSRLIADVTSGWQQDLVEFLSPAGFLMADADASGLRATNCGADLLPEPSPEEWSTWSGVLKAFDSWRISQKGTSRGINRHTEPLQQLVLLHGKAPAIMATDRYDTIVQQELGRESAAAVAIALFREFWKERQGTKMPDPSKGLLFGAQLPAKYCVPVREKAVATIRARKALQLPSTWGLELEPRFRATEPPEEGDRVFEDEAELRAELQRQLEERQSEQRRRDKVAQDWNLPPRYQVEFEDDGTPFVLSPEGDIRYDAPENVPRPTWMSNRNKKMTGGVDRDIVAAAHAMDFKKVRQLLHAKDLSEKSKEGQAAFEREREEKKAQEREKTTANETGKEKEQQPGCPDGGDDEAAAKKGGTGKTVEARCRAGHMPVVKKTADEPAGERKTVRKYTKSVGLRAMQEKQIETGELELKANCWRLMGVRDVHGNIMSVEACKEKDPAKVTCVFAQVASEITQAEQEKVRKQWGIDDSWQVLVRTRLIGNQVTVVSPQGRMFMKKSQLTVMQKGESLRQARNEEMQAFEEMRAVLAAAASNRVFEVVGATGPAAVLNGVYLQHEDGGSMRFVKCSKAFGSCSTPVEVSLGSGCWDFAAHGRPLATRSSGSSPFLGDQKFVFAEAAGAADAAALNHCEGRPLLLEAVVAALSSKPSEGPLPGCGVCRASSQLGTPGATPALSQRAAFEERLRALGARRQNAPRSLGGMARHMVSKLLDGEWDMGSALLRFFGRGGGGSGTIRLGTLCSGTDSPAIALKHLASALGGLLPEAPAGGLPFEHVFSCEFDEAKQGFLLKNFPDVGNLFSDCTQMGRQRAWDVKSQSVQDIPGNLDFLVAGFSCKDLSFMNSYRKTLEEMGQSGRTLRGCFDYVERYRPRVVLLENVFAIDRADQRGLKQVNIVMEGLRTRGYVAGYTLLNSCDYYLPQIRHRIWMWGFRQDLATGSDATRDQAFEMGQLVNPKMQELLKTLEEPCALHFDDLLLSEDDTRVQEFNRQLHNKVRRRQEAGDSKGINRMAKLTWQQKYSMHRAKLDYAEEKPYTSERGARWRGMLNERHMELLDLKCLDVLNEQGMDPREVPMLWDLLQSVERVPGSRVRRDRQNYATCVLPPSSLWHTVRHRFVLGQEKLALQGIFEEDMLDFKSFPQTLLSDLAGNAFTSSVCLACMLAAAAISEEASQATSSPLAALSPVLAENREDPDAKRRRLGGK